MKFEVPSVIGRLPLRGSTAWQDQLHALRMTAQYRHCPPISVLEKGGELVSAHLRRCSFCRDEAEPENIEALERVGKAIFEAAKKAGFKRTPPTTPKVGDIRRVRPSVPAEAYWDWRGVYYNPPLVMVLEADDDGSGFVTVAQVFDAVVSGDLADWGDVAIDHDKGKALLYAEAWNMYGLPSKRLAGHVYACAEEGAVDRVLAKAQECPDVVQGTPLAKFRERELLTGSFFSMRLNAEALAEMEDEA